MVDDLDQVVLGGLVHAAAFDARIDEGAEADMGEQAGPPGADLAEQLHRDAAGKHIGLDLVVAARAPACAATTPSGRRSRACTMPSCAKRFMPRDLRSPMPSEWITVRPRGWPRFEKALLDRRVQAGRLHQAAAAADQRDGVAVPDQRDRGRSAVTNLLIAMLSSSDHVGEARRAVLQHRRARSTVRWISDVPSKMRKMRASR